MHTDTEIINIIKVLRRKVKITTENISISLERLKLCDEALCWLKAWQNGVCKESIAASIGHMLIIELKKSKVMIG